METYHKIWNIRMLLIVATIFSAWADDAIECTGLTTSNDKSGNIKYNETYNRNCTWLLPKPAGEDHILVLKVLKSSLKRGDCIGYLTILGILRFCEIKIRCLIIGRLSNFDTKQAYAAANSARSRRRECIWIILGDKLPAEITLSTWNTEQKSFRLDYVYISVDAVNTTATTTSAINYSTSSDKGTETDSDAPTIHFGVFAAVVLILVVLLILCALAIVWMQRRHNKVILTSNALRGSIRAAARIQASTLQRVEERQQPNEHGEANIGYNPPQAYAEIAGCSTAVQQSGSAEHPEAQYHQVSYVNQSGLSRRDDYGNSAYAAVDNPESPQVSYDSPMNVDQQEVESDDQPSAQYAVLNKKQRVVQ